MSSHLIGLLLGAEEDWPQAFEAILRRVGPLKVRFQDPRVHQREADHRALRPDRPGAQRARDRPAGLLVLPPARVAEEGLAGQRNLPAQQPVHVPVDGEAQRLLRDAPARPQGAAKTVLVPYKNPVDNVRWAYTSEKYNEDFDLDELAAQVGYPLYMKPFDGGGWRGVSRVNNRDDLHRAYDESGEMLMHLQATVDYESFARALSIGPETMVMDFKPEKPMHQRYAVSHGFLSESAGNQAVAISRIVNAFFRWEFNSCEMLVAGDDVHPIDYANACPDVAVTSLALLLPVGDQGAGALVGLLRGDRPDRPHRPPHEPLLRGRRRHDLSTTTRSWPATSTSPTSTSRPSATGTGAARTCRTSTSRSTTGSPPTTSTGCCARPCRRRTPRTSRRSSSRTSAGCSACGWPISRRAQTCDVISGTRSPLRT